MSNYKTDRDYKIINQYAGSLSVDRAIQNEEDSSSIMLLLILKG